MIENAIAVSQMKPKLKRIKVWKFNFHIIHQEEFQEWKEIIILIMSAHEFYKQVEKMYLVM